ncbi:conserved hypothetical protein [Anaeromyxobacter sp. K]|uniref:hypothetical protein n=1 Tax=Anaeromyxobacter sp. (strain K) TaxID=447217 RepID=UPI00015F8A67|nr:hypothetical protein [Anaeromyxobacter sp. K]ACG75005.1 conserved hypothetical protein [Anaeromyxobacter sp. K]
MLAPSLVALALCSAAHGGNGRLLLSARAGAGWAGDTYLGADMGGGAFAELSPSARLDLSLAPRLKLDATGEVSLARYQAGGFGATSGSAGVRTRWLGDGWEASLAAAAEHAAFTSGVPLGDLAAGPQVDATTAALLTPQLRVRTGPVALRAAVTGALRSSRASGDRVGERGLAALAAAEWAPCRRAALELSLRHERVASEDPAFELRAWGGAASALLNPLGALEASAVAQVHRAALHGGVDETAWRATLDLAHPAGPVWLVVSGGWARSATGGAGRAVADRATVFAGVRGSARVLSW